MACCCTKILELCRVSVCGTDTIKTGANAPATGVYKLVLDYLDTDIVFSKAIAIGSPLDFPSDGLNEDYKYTGKILAPDGSVLTLTLEDIVYDCISFQTGLQYPMNEVTCPEIDASEWVAPEATVGVQYYAELPLNGSPPYTAEFVSQPGWMGISIVGDKIVLQGMPDIDGEIELSIKAANCAQPVGLAPTFTQPFITNPA